MSRQDGASSAAGAVSRSGAPLRICIEGGSEPRTMSLDAVREVIVGRDASAAVRLGHDAVSRQHLRLFERDGRWYAEDLGSRHGTMVDGVLLAPRKPVPVGRTATILVRPFALRLELGTDHSTRTDSPRLEDAGESGLVRALSAEELGALNGRRLSLLLEVADLINAARDERAVADAATAALITGTGFARALMLRWAGGMETLDTLSVRTGADADAVPSSRVSRTLLSAAAAGAVVRLEDVDALREAESIVGSGVAAALCAPVIVPPLVEAFLYLDSQRRSARPNPDAAAFCQIVAKLCGLAIGNLRRVAAEQRHLELEQQLAAARRAQQSLLPAERGVMQGCRWRLYSRPGQLVAGDIAGVHGADDCVTFFIGDVRGKGVDSAIVMSLVASHLSACLSMGMQLAEAITLTGAFVHANRRDEADFVSLMAAQVDRRRGVLRVADAGHGYGVLIADGRVETIEAGGGPVLGIAPDLVYDQSEWPIVPGMRLLLLTDGVAEQQGTEARGMFGMEAVAQCVAGAADAEALVDGICSALRRHAGGDCFADDVTILCVDTA